MEKYHKIAVKNVCVVNVCFRRIGKLYNDGKIVVDVDSYDFAGRLTDDVIVGFYENGKYHIYYYYKNYDFDVDLKLETPKTAEYIYNEYLIEMSTKFEKNSPEYDFVGNKISFYLKDDEFELSFEIIVSDMQEIQKAINYNMDLLMPKI